MINIPFLDLQPAYRELKPEIDAAVTRVLESGQYILGEDVEVFEKEFSAYVDAAQCVGVGNGLDALTLGLRAIEVGCGDEVIVPANTYIATWLAVNAVGAKPVAVEPEEDTYNIDPSCIEAAISAKTKAIIPVHLYGHPADLDPILALAKKHRLWVLEDAAQAHGARYKGRRIGAHGDLVAWSFYPGKNLGAFGDGGAVTTNNRELAQRIAMLRNYGSLKKYKHEIRGANSRLDPLQAAILRVKLKYLDDWNARRKYIAAAYSDCLTGQPGIAIPKVREWAEPVWHLYVTRYAARDALRAWLKMQGIEAMIHYPTPPHLQPAYTDIGIKEGAFPLTERLSNSVLSLPMGPHLGARQATAVSTSVCYYLNNE